MIAASEPLEFVPHGRTVIAKHPGKIYKKGHNSSVSENSLLYKLTNFGIKDESLLDTAETEDQEWWSIREVYYRNDEEFDDDPPQSPKDMRDEYMSDSFRPPSGLKMDFNNSVKTELFRGGKKMDTDVINSAGTSRGGSANSSSNMSKKFNVNIGQNRNPRRKPLNPKTDSSYEEELYIKGCTAVWSKGLISTPATKLSGPEFRETICCYTIENPIKHATFCNFHISINNTMLIDALNSQICDEKKNIKIEDTTEHLLTQMMPSILLIDNKCMRVFATDGREYITSIPFQVKKVWPMKYGVLLEKEATPLIHNSLLPLSFLKPNDSHNSTFSKSKTNIPFNMSAKLRAESLSGYEQDVPLPTCFSLSHPLDEVTPILMKSPSQGLQYYNDGDLQIIFVSTNPSIILLYDWKLATHSLWKIRKTIREECLTMCPNINSTTTMFSQSCEFMGSPMHSNVRNATSWAAGAGSPFQSRKGSGTPTRSRVNSPMANIFHQQGLSPHASIGQASSNSMMGNNMAQSPPSLPLYPEICLDHIWLDSQTIRRDPIESLDDLKTFLHTDLVGHDYLCFLVKVAGISRLQIMRLQKSHSHGSCSKTNLIVGSVSSVLAKDAVVLEHLKMIALIDESGNIILQSGNCIVGKVHAGGVLARLLDSRGLQAPFPRRSSLLPAAARDPPEDAGLHLLSPVPHVPHAHAHTHTHPRVDHRDSLGLRGLCDPAGSRMTLKFDGGLMYRISLPEVACSNLVTRCCTALRSILPKDITMQVIIKWYGVRNAPGTQDLTPEQEWSMFSNLLFSLIGYDVEKLTMTKQNDDQIEHAGVATKKQRTSSDGTQDDWEYLLNSKLHKAIGSSLASVLMLPIPNAERHRCEKKVNQETEKSSQFNTNCLLFPYILQILYAFHLTYEEIKLNTLLHSDLEPLAKFLYQIAKDLKLDSYVNYYWLDFPMELNLEYEESDSQMTENVLKKLTQPSYFSDEPPNVFGYFNAMLKDIDVGYYPYLADVNEMSKDLIEVMCCAERAGGGEGAAGGGGGEGAAGGRGGVQSVARRGVAAGGSPRAPPRPPRAPHDAPHYAAAAELAHRGITTRDIEVLPPALGVYVAQVCAACRSGPPPDWPSAAHRLVLRDDLARQADIADTLQHATDCMETIALGILEKETAYSTVSKHEEESVPSKNDDSDTATGMEHLDTKLLKLLYPRDHRMTEVINLLQSSIPVTINLTQRPEVSDHDFIEEQEKHLYAISTRTMALPVARGMLTLRTLPCSPTEPLTLPKLCVAGRGPPPRRNTIALGGGDTSPHCLLWPSFHNGVAAGLALVPMTGASIDSSWIIYNKPRGTAEMSTEHAGFLMALGLNGHLRDMPFMNMYEYLVKCNEMVSVGLLLGLAATYRGTMDVQATKMMSIHLEPLLPPTSIELDIQQNILVAAILGVGLLFQGTQHSHYARVLLDEIGKPSGGETESCGEREGYALAAGLALGMVTAGGRPGWLAPRLRALLAGGGGAGAAGAAGAAGPAGAAGHADVTGPGATLALGLAWWRAGARAPPAHWLRAPATAYELDAVRPDLLMLRIIARGLIIWDSIEPTDEWIDSEVPDTIKPYVFAKPVEDHIDYEAMNQAYCNIVGGACFALGLRFAGSGDEDARDVALRHARRFLALAASPAADLAGRATLEACLCVCLLAAGMVMAGRGDVSTLRLCRRLRARLPAAPAPPLAAGRARPAHAAHPSHPAHPAPPLSHGGQMAVHCTVGLLFLGGGRATLGTSAGAVAALLAAFFPKFPTHSEDNRYHLQAFRHLYVLAVEPRLILPRDIDSGKLCYAHIQVIDLVGVTKEMMAPCIIPELDTLKEVKINDSRYWPITFQRDRNWDQLKIFLQHTWCIDLKQRAGCLSHADDPRGFLTMLAQTLTLDRSNVWSLAADGLKLISDETVKRFVSHYLTNDDDKNGKICADCLVAGPRRRGAGPAGGAAGAAGGAGGARRACVCRRPGAGPGAGGAGARLAAAAYRCALRDALCVLPAAAALLQIVNDMNTNPTSYHVWQIKLLKSQMENHSKKAMSEMTVDGQEENEPLISAEFALSLKQAACSALDSYQLKMTPFLRKYLGAPSSRKISNCDQRIKKMLSAYIVYYELPKDVLKSVVGDDELSVLLELESMGLTAEVICEIQSLLR